MNKPRTDGDWWKQGSFNGCWTFGTGCKHSALPPEKRRLGCKNCWACEFVKNGRMARVHSGEPGVVVPYHKIMLHPERLEKPLKRRKPSVFTNIYVETFDLPEEHLGHVLCIIERCPQHTFVLFTKKPKEAAELLPILFDDYCTWESPEGETGLDIPENLIILASTWDQKSTDDACKALSGLPVRWGLHCEPLLGPIDLNFDGYELGPNKSLGFWHHRDCPSFCDFACGGLESALPSWVVCGGETGSNARPMRPDWVRNIRDQCKATGVPFWLKSWGEWCPSTETSGYDVKSSTLKHSWDCLCSYRIGKKKSGRLLDGREHNEVPWRQQ